MNILGDIGKSDERLFKKGLIKFLNSKKEYEIKKFDAKTKIKSSSNNLIDIDQKVIDFINSADISSIPKPNKLKNKLNIKVFRYRVFSKR